MPAGVLQVGHVNSVSCQAKGCRIWLREQNAGLTVSTINKIVEGVVVAVECNLVVPLQICMTPLLVSTRKSGDLSQ